MEWCVALVQHGLLLGLLHVSEVLVLAETASLVFAQASEGLSSAQLVLWGHFEGTLWAGVAIVLNSVDDESEAVDLSQVALWNGDLLWLRFVRVFGNFLLGTSFIIIVHRVVNRCVVIIISLLGVEQLVWLAQEVSGASINEFVVLSGWETEAWHFLEFEFGSTGRQSPVELLVWELVLALECNGECDIVVSVQASHLAPEEHLISLNRSSKLAEGHLQLDSKQDKVISIVSYVLTSRRDSKWRRCAGSS